MEKRKLKPAERPLSASFCGSAFSAECLPWAARPRHLWNSYKIAVGATSKPYDTGCTSSVELESGLLCLGLISSNWSPQFWVTERAEVFRRPAMPDLFAAAFMFVSFGLLGLFVIGLTKL
jgi:hypothetical protein